ncbi:MAG: L-aspartate oxidase [Phycisphaerae bacterium]|nr:L-aspartate oxidase [Phycisphaerae bacterium]
MFHERRHLTDFHSSRIGHVVTDVLVIGSGVAGARAAIEAGASADVILISKKDFSAGATRYAQGGIACAVGDDDNADAHLADTIRVGCGLNRRTVVEHVVRSAPALLDELTSWGFAVDRVDGRVALAREGGHSRSRVVHARGDATGLELSETLQRRIRSLRSIRVFEQCFLVDLVTIDGACVGAITHHAKYGHQIIWAQRTILAGGGCGQVYRETTNPATITGDALAAAYRAGAVISDVEFVQFHPTTLYIAGAGRALISEAVRGEGAHLVDRAGLRFMPGHHPDAELAPRDVVSRAITRHMLATRTNCVYLDARHVRGFPDRFPSITKLCAEFQIDVSRDLIPVRPSAHYLIGGIETDAAGATSVPGLLACGECACTGLHGANRLASNSLLEGLVTGVAAGRAAADAARSAARATTIPLVRHESARSDRTELDLADIRNSLRSVMWRNVGIERAAERLRETVEILDFWGHYVLDKTFDEPAGWETQNLLTVARLIAVSALARPESIGVHFRSDAPSGALPALYHTRCRRGDADRVERSP